MITCAIYPRKSKANDNSQSMEQQIAECTNYIKTHYSDTRIILYDGDYALTGHSTAKRKDFLRMMDDVRAKKIQLVVIMRYDRIARNMRDFCNLYHDMEEAGCNLVSISQQIDTSTPYGKNFMYQMASMAELEWAIISERYKDTAKYKREHGYAYTGRVPYGYMIRKDEDGHKRVVKDTEHDAMVVFDYYRNCRSKSKTLQYIKSNYYPQFSYDVLRKMFESDMYFGKVKGNDHFCEPYITEEEMEEIRKIKVIKTTPTGLHYIFSSMVICPICGRNLYVMRAGKNQKIIYYRCGFAHHEKIHETIMINENKIEEELVERLDLILQDKIASASSSSRTHTIESVEPLKKEQERLNYLFEKGRISIEDYEKKFDALESKINEIEESTKDVDYTNAITSFALGWKDIYHQLNRENQKAFWHQTIKEIHINMDKEITDVIFM